MRRTSSPTTTVPTASPPAALLKTAWPVFRPAGSRSVNAAKATPAANRQREDQTARPYSEHHQAIVQPPNCRLCQVSKSSTMTAWAATPAMVG